MEKWKPHYSLTDIQACLDSPDKLGAMTLSARNGARALHFSDEDITAVIQELSFRNFRKSMTSYGDHRIWQDVYYSTYRGRSLYVKFTCHANSTFLLISFKARGER